MATILDLIKSRDRINSILIIEKPIKIKNVIKLSREVNVVDINQNGITTVRDKNHIFDVYDSQLIYPKNSISNSVFLRGV